MTSATRAKTTTAAEKRRQWHENRIEEAPTWRAKIWHLAGWIIAEAKRAKEHRDDAERRLTELAVDLNGKNGESDDDT